MVYMTPLKLIGLRLFVLTFGRISAVGRVLRKAIIGVVVKKSAQPYVASSKFFTPEDLKS